MGEIYPSYKCAELPKNFDQKCRLKEAHFNNIYQRKKNYNSKSKFNKNLIDPFVYFLKIIIIPHDVFPSTKLKVFLKKLRITRCWFFHFG